VNLDQAVAGIPLVEWIGFLFGIAGIWLGIKEKIAYFPVSLINVIASAYIFFHQALYSDVLQQLVYVVLLSYGWYRWLNGKVVHQPLNVSNASQKLILILLAVIILLTLLMGTYFDRYTQAQLPYWDALATSLCFAAQYLMAEKKIENWLVWIDVNLIYIGIYLYKGLPLYAILFTIYLIMAIVGYFKWQNHLIANEERS
jgi:nicotinamide mononucleotide transporter